VIVGICTCRNEESIIGKTVSHVLADAAHVVISDGGSTDNTRDILAGMDRVTLLEQTGEFDQPAETLRLAEIAVELGADWVVPFDADEFWIGLGQLNALQPNIGVAEAVVFGHRDWDNRYLHPRIQGKVAARRPRSFAWGNHSVEADGIMVGGFEIRELQYQSFEHFLEKIEKSRELFERSSFSEIYGSHMRSLVSASDEARVFEWERLMAEPAVFDPIPYRGAR
jgi:glycosyltransferase involved in cell wall biosynthesis